MKTMASNDDLKFDPVFARDLLLEISLERDLDALMKMLVKRILQRPMVARVRIWLVRPGDICRTCSRRQECPDQTRCLHAVAGGSNPVEAESIEYALLKDRFSRIPIGVGPVGKIAATGAQIILSDLDRDPQELSHVEWLKAEKVRGFNGVPIEYKGEVLGVIAVFSRANVPDEARMWGRVFANHVAGAIANARAFEEIRLLKAQLEEQNAYLREEVVEAKAFGGLIGQSAALRQIISQIDLVAPTDASVLILGETGVGKELVAHEIHSRSRRSDKPLIRVNCASIPAELYESEFFGHAKGSFTGAIRDRAGRFETAEGGTIFLDEIGEIPLALQGKLLRVLQERQYERVGEDRTRRADVRVIGATNRDLKREVAAGRFREDLYYRLNVFPIQVAPLRERREDIPLLAQHFVKLSVKELCADKPRLTRTGIAQLQNYDWPGNIRELRNVVERAVILAQGSVLEFDLPAGGTRPVILPDKSAEPDSGADRGFLNEAEVKQNERENILRVLHKAGWRIKGAGGAAELLGVRPTTLISRLKKMKIQRPASSSPHSAIG